MNLTECRSYREYIRGWIREQPRKGRGQLRQISNHLREQPSMLSQVMSGAKELSQEQGFRLAGFFGFGAEDAEHFLTLIQYERAGDASLKEHLKRRLDGTRKAARREEMTKKGDWVVTEEEGEHSMYFSHWYYGAIRTLLHIEGRWSAQAIAVRLRLPVSLVNRCLKYLVEHGYCTETRGHYRAIKRDIFVQGDLMPHHLRNWRVKALEYAHLPVEEGEGSYSTVVSVSKDCAREIRKVLGDAIQKSQESIESQKRAETVFLMNIDWRELR